MTSTPETTQNLVTILVVEDSPTQLEQLRFLLEESGYRVVAATNGQEGLAAARANAIDLVISDIVMPEMDGYELCQALRADQTLQRLPVILLTSLADSRDVIRGLESGANNFISKPYDGRELRARVRTVLANQEIRDKCAPSEMGISVHFDGQRFLITADRLQILDLLLSTYENSVNRNDDLIRTRDELRVLNEQLEKRVAERTAALTAEIEERRRTQEGLGLANARLQALWRVSSGDHADAEMVAKEILAAIVRMTDSETGFYGLVNEDESVMTIRGWSGETMAGCSVADEPREFRIGEAGVWAEAVRRRAPLIMNDYAAPHAGKKGLPEGHVALRRLLVVPQSSFGKVTAVAAVANRAVDYGPDDARQIAAFLGGIQAISDRKRAEEALRESEERFRRAINATGEGLWEWDILAGREFFSPRWCEVVGYSFDDPELPHTYDSWAERIHPDDSGRVNSALRNHLEKGTKYDVDYRHRHKSGEYRWQNSKGQAIFDESGKPAKMVGCISDITDRKRAEEALLRRTGELARSNAELEQFAYVASHDLQEPLRMVASYTQLLAKRYKGRLDADADDFIEFAVDGAKRMQQLIVDLLAYARIGTRGQEFRATSSEAALSAALQNLATAIRESDAAIRSGPLPPVWADPVQLQQIFQNLLGNAIKFRHAGRPEIQVSGEESGAEWHFRVADNGIGIDPQQADRIFQVFQRLHTREQYPGTGIGLPICKKIAERHGGRIWVEPRPGYGTTFHFTISKSGSEAPS
jgi:PAS domain S-box-containing protein